VHYSCQTALTRHLGYDRLGADQRPLDSTPANSASGGEFSLVQPLFPGSFRSSPNPANLKRGP